MCIKYKYFIQPINLQPKCSLNRKIQSLMKVRAGIVRKSMLVFVFVFVLTVLEECLPARQQLDLCLKTGRFGLTAFAFEHSHLPHEPRLHVVITRLIQHQLCTRIIQQYSVDSKINNSSLQLYYKQSLYEQHSALYYYVNYEQIAYLLINMRAIMYFLHSFPSGSERENEY